ncbi:Crp/Fnr family transcriptional regulator [Dyadobacter diqingensis]|uniref:Crp/Fnr family transcriptional regulator n=1 Tax=Dyadobacter diqingensis TaxID=2938121 RepID=UPI0020C52A9F|nr:Crp/Fnr family transcriptional regulator [Dyadobacter diqingensis]
MNPIDQLKAALSSFTEIPDEEFHFFSKNLQIKSFENGTFLCREGQIEQHIFFLLSGATRNYFTRDGKEFTVGFHFEDEFITAFYSLLTREPSPVSIEVIQSSRTFLIPRAFLYDFYDKFKTGERIGRLIAEAQYIKRLEREMELLSLTAEQRYAKLMERNPALVQGISIKHLSSYLGIQPESLSRIRKQFARN